MWYSDSQFITNDQRNAERLVRADPKFFVVFKGRWCTWELDENDTYGWGKKIPAAGGKGIGIYGMFQRHHGVERLVRQLGEGPALLNLVGWRTTKGKRSNRSQKKDTRELHTQPFQRAWQAYGTKAAGGWETNESQL